LFQLGCCPSRHAGYSYSGPCAAWAYKALDLSGIKRVFVLGPSHTYYLAGSALSNFAQYATPLGNLAVDQATTEELKGKGIKAMRRRNEEAEHSLEMHLPYLYKRMAQAFGPDASTYPPIVPVLVGDGKAEEQHVGKMLAPYLADEGSAFVVSSDFCHWGPRFQYTKYSPDADVATLTDLKKKPGGGGKPIHETIRVVDKLAMDAIETGSYEAFWHNLERTENTVCGRHPIAVMMAAMEELARRQEGKVGEGKLRFKFVRYERSNLVESHTESSVSYAAAYAVV
jgi:MEMO1 family protein